MSLIGGVRSGLGGVRTTAESSGGSGSSSSAALFDLELSYGHGVAADQQLPAATSFWFTPTTVGDLAVADQVREWVTTEALGFLALVVRVDASTLPTNGARFVVSVDGAETAISLSVSSGSTANQTLEIGALLDVAAGSRIGVKWSGANVQAGASLRAEIRLQGYLTGTPTTPTALPSDPLALYLPTSLAADGETWGDTTGNGFDAAVPVVVGAGAPAVSTLNGHRAASFDGVKQVLATGNEMFVGGVTPAARTLMAVVRPTNATGGTVGCFNQTADYFSCTLWKTAGNQFSYENGAANNSQLASVVDYGGDDLVLVWRTDGTTIEFFVNGVLRAAVTNTCGPDNGIAPGFVIGNNLANFGDRGWFGLIDFEGVWARRWTDAEVLSGTAYAAENYL